MDSLKQGAKQMIRVCMGLKTDEKLIIVSERSKQNIINAIKSEALNITDSVDVFFVDDWGPRPVSKIPNAVVLGFESSDVSIVILDKFPGELSTIRTPLKELGLKYSRHANCPGLNEAIMKTGMCADHIKLKEFSEKLFNVLKSSSIIHITSPAGSDLLFKLSSEYNWINSNGSYSKRPQTGTNLPGAEVFTHPKDVSGIAIIDGLIGDFFTAKYGLIEKTPLKLVLKNKRVINCFCENKELLSDFRKYINTDKNSSMIGELGLGANIFLKEFVGVMLQDEKYPGAHIAVGHGYPSWTNAKYNSKVHCDLIMKDVSIWADETQIMKNGKYLI